MQSFFNFTACNDIFYTFFSADQTPAAVGSETFSRGIATTENVTALAKGYWLPGIWHLLVSLQPVTHPCPAHSAVSLGFMAER